MDEQDKDIRKLFDEYADGLEPRPELSKRAREKLVSRRRDTAHRGRRAALVLACMAGAAASVTVCVFAVNTFFGAVGGGNSGGSGDHSPAEPDTSYGIEYDVGDVRAVRITREDASEYFDLSPVEAKYEIFSESYYACYMKESGELAYIRGAFGMSADSGTTQVALVAENSQFRRTDLGADFAAIISSDGSPVTARTYIDGEYVSKTYLDAHGLHYYVTTMGNDAYAYNVIADILTA